MYRVCKHPRCNTLCSKTYCNKHSNYSSTIYNDKRKNDKAIKFYRSKQWVDKRLDILKRDAFMCVMCGGEANLVHHVVEVRVDFDKRLDDDNLQSVCRSCHNKIDHKKVYFKNIPPV